MVFMKPMIELKTPLKYLMFVHEFALVSPSQVQEAFLHVRLHYFKVLSLCLFFDMIISTPGTARDYNVNLKVLIFFKLAEAKVEAI